MFTPRKTVPYYLLSSMLLLLGLLLFVSCDDEDDNNTVDPVINQSLDGEWAFTLAPLDGNDGEASTATGIYLYEHENTANGYSPGFGFQGSINDNQISLDVFLIHSDPVSEHAHMDLTKVHDDTLIGTGSIIHPAITIPPNSSGEVNPKFQTEHIDWDGGHGGVYFYNVTAVRQGEAPPEIHFSELCKDRQTDETFREAWDDVWCDAIMFEDHSVMQDILPGQYLSPMASCHPRSNGGGFYIYGDRGPGERETVLTNCFYYPWEWSLCHHRTYSFEISLESALDTFTVLTDADILASLNLAPDTIQEMYDQMTEHHGGWAICFAQSMHSNNISLYVLHDHGHDIWERDLVSNIRTAINDLAPESVFHLSDTSCINDCWSLTRTQFFGCNTPVVFYYLMGTHEVKFN